MRGYTQVVRLSPRVGDPSWQRCLAGTAVAGRGCVDEIRFQVKFVPAGTGSAVWDDTNAGCVIQRFMPHDRNHGPMIGIVHLGGVRPTPSVLRDVVVTVGEDVKAGRYGEFNFIISSEDEATRSVIRDVATAQDVAMFVSSSSVVLEDAEPVGALTVKDHETLDLVLTAGGTVTVMEFARRVGIEQTTAGNRLVSLHKKGYLQRLERPHPTGDLFMDPRSIRFRSERASLIRRDCRGLTLQSSQQNIPIRGQRPAEPSSVILIERQIVGSWPW